jgi:hypothetical protein
MTAELNRIMLVLWSPVRDVGARPRGMAGNWQPIDCEDQEPGPSKEEPGSDVQ